MKKVGKLNYLFVMPRVVQKIGEGYIFPLGICYVSSNMRKHGFNVFTLNLNHKEGDIQDVLKREIEAHDIDVVATGGLSFQYATIKKIVDVAKNVRRDIVVVVGGGIISADPEASMLALERADIGVIGEGELTMVELGRALEAGGSLAGVNGLIYPDGAGFKTTSARKENRDLDSLPWPDYEGFDFEKALEISAGVSGVNEKRTAFMIASRSCPYQCSFCFHTTGRVYRQRSMDNFFSEVEYMISRYGIRFIFLADELFSSKMDRVEEYCRRIKKYNIKWWAQFRVDQITPEMIALIKEGNCGVMSFGLESADNGVLKSMKKHITIEQTEKALKLTYDAGISFEGAFIFGDSGETWESANNTLEWWRRHPEYKIHLNLITVYPGTPLYQEACQKGIIPDRVKFLKEGCPQVNVSKLTDSQFSELMRNIMEIPWTLAKTLKSVRVSNMDFNTGRMDVTGVCDVCGTENLWDNMRLFSTNFLGCKNCGQRYNSALPQEYRQNIEKNLDAILAEHKKIGVWAINYHVADLFNKSAALKRDGVFAIDISKTKKNMDLYGKRIQDPEVIERENIEVVVIGVPVFFSQIEEAIRAQHPNVKKIIDLCKLVNPAFKS